MASKRHNLSRRAVLGAAAGACVAGQRSAPLTAGGPLIQLTTAYPAPPHAPPRWERATGMQSRTVG